MASNNNWTGFGRLTRDPEVRKYDKNGEAQSVVNFTIACDRWSRNDHPAADFVRCKVFGKRADTLAQYTHKGSRLVVSGAWHQEKYTDKEGNERADWTVTVDDFSFCETKVENSNFASAATTPAPAPQPAAPTVEAEDDWPF